MLQSATQAAPGREFTDILLDQSGLSVDRLPMLNVVFDRVASQCVEALRQLSTTPAYLQVEEISTGRIGDILDEYRGSIAAVYHSREWESQILIGLDRGSVFALAEAMFGGDGSEPAFDHERALSTIEMRIAQIIFDQTTQALQTSFLPVCQTSFKFERVETRMDFVVIGRRNNNAVVAKIRLRALERGGALFIVIPQTALNPFRQNLTRDVSADLASRDPRWTKQMEGEIGRTEITLRAVIKEADLTLGDIAALRVGQVLKLKATPATPVELEASEQTLFRCQLGQAEGFYTVRIDEHVDQEQERMDDILSR